MEPDIKKLENDAIEFVSLAIHFDSIKHFEAAAYYYKEACQALFAARSNGSQLPDIEAKVKEYTQRLKVLLDQLESQKIQDTAAVLPNQHQLELNRVKFLVGQAFEEDEANNKEDATELYMQATELCIQLKSKTNDATIQSQLTKLAQQALERAECLKGVKSPVEESVSHRPVSPRPARATYRPIPPLGFTNLDVQARSSHHAGGISSGTNEKYNLQVSGSQSYGKEEIDVLRFTSFINRREYVPFLVVDLKEQFAYPLPYSDKDGKLILSPKQIKSFKKWVRPDEICPHPKMIEVIDCYSIKQTVVSDCSFVASLAISAQYEKKFKKRLITSIIYPQTRNGDPVYNPCGKYMIKFHINGVPRKVIIDDYLPIGSSGELLCSYSTNRNELWISLLEKAYMKVMGGYDFPGSNSNIDLHALTGWIPERVSIQPGDKEFDSNAVFRKLLAKFPEGEVLVTMATGPMSDDEADRAGLVPTHAYAMLDIREVRGKRLLLLKNPWSHMRWKGNYSERDTVHWTSELKAELNYDPKNAQMFDNGVFWIDYDSICQFFEVIYMNWNPSLFKYTYSTHQKWKAGSSPIKDSFNIGENPQYSLEVNSPHPSAVWVLLTRHITDKEDFAVNKEYITILVYKNEGQRVYYPYDPPPHIDGTRINSPHYLCKMIVDPKGTCRYTLVVAQYEKMNTIHYTLRVYSTCPFTLAKIGNPYTFQQEVTNGEWKGISAGGCGNHPATYKNNPVYQLQLNNFNDDNNLLIDLKGPKQYQMGFDLVMISVNNQNSKNQFTRKSSGCYRSGFVILPLNDVPAGVYHIIPSTFLPGQEGPFFLKVQASCPIKLGRIQ